MHCRTALQSSQHGSSADTLCHLQCPAQTAKTNLRAGASTIGQASAAHLQELDPKVVHDDQHGVHLQLSQLSLQKFRPALKGRLQGYGSQGVTAVATALSVWLCTPQQSPSAQLPWQAEWKRPAPRCAGWHSPGRQAGPLTSLPAGTAQAGRQGPLTSPGWHASPHSARLWLYTLLPRCRGASHTAP